MYEKILEKNITFINGFKAFRSYNTELTELVEELNTKKIVTLSWMRHTWKTGLIQNFLKKTNSFESTFYYNHEINLLSPVASESELMVLMDMYVRIYGIPKVVILQNCNALYWIKSFIQKLYKSKKYKLIIVWNNIKIQWVRDIILYPLHLQKNHIDDVCFWWIPEVRIIPDIHYKKFLLEILRNDIICRDILEAYTIKNISLFYKVLSYIAQNSEYQSLREIHRNLWYHGVDIALLTLIDYINAAVNTHILHRIYLYDIKNNNSIQSKAQYIFWDVWIRFSLIWEDISYHDNALKLEFLSRWFTVSWWLNGRFQFQVYAQKNAETFCIALDMNQTDKNEIRKTARKLSKIWWPSKKYVLVQDIWEYHMRKQEEQWVPIINFSEILEIISSK
jgi:predicted AAA+ superfamily ATPase